MNKFLDELYERASKKNKTIALAEGFDKRAVKAAELLTKRGICKVVLIGNPDEIAKKNPEIDLAGVTVVNPATCDKTEEYANLLCELRKAKGMTPEQAKELTLNNEMFFGTLMLKAGDVDGLVSGACHSTANTLRPGLQVIKTAPGINTVSSCFIMIADRENKYNPDGVAVFADCAINIEAPAQQIADIAISTAETAKNIAQIEPRVAMLSFSTKGSGNDDKFFKSVPKMQEATALAKAAAPET